jgi:hypothetical protein
MVPIAVLGPGGEPLTDYALADTGADSTAFPLDRAVELGIDLEADCVKEEVTTANGVGTQFVYKPGLAAVVEETQFATFCSQTETLIIRPYDES